VKYTYIPEGKNSDLNFQHYLQVVAGTANLLLQTRPTPDEAIIAACWIAAEAQPFTENECLDAVQMLMEKQKKQSRHCAAAIHACLPRMPQSTLVLCALLAPCSEARKTVPPFVMRSLISEATWSISSLVLVAILVKDDHVACVQAIECLINNSALLSPEVCTAALLLPHQQKKLIFRKCDFFL